MQKFTAFCSSPDERILIANGTLKDQQTGANISTLQSWRVSTGNVLKKDTEIRIETLWAGEGYDAIVDMVLSPLRSDGYHLFAATLNSGNLFVVNVVKDQMLLLNKL